MVHEPQVRLMAIEAVSSMRAGVALHDHHHEDRELPHGPALARRVGSSGTYGKVDDLIC